MARHRKPGRPKGSKSKKDNIVGCSKLRIYRRVKGRIVKATGVKHKACLEKIK